MAALISTRDDYHRVAHVYLPVALAVFAIVAVLVAATLVRYRARPDRRPSRRSEHTGLELAFVVGLVGVVAALLTVTFAAEHQIDTVSAHEKPGLVIDVTASKWEWRFTYLGLGVSRLSGAVGHQPLAVPTQTAIRFRLASLDVIHSFWIPELDFKRAVIPGAATSATLTFTRPGAFAGECAEFCGTDHYRMTFTVDALTPAAFAAWELRQRGGTA
jgi:cytochrome c oxidase subunit 2